MTQQDTSTKKEYFRIGSVFAGVSPGSSQGHMIVNHKICQTLQPDFNFGFGQFMEFEIKSPPCTLRNASHQVVCCLEVFEQRSKRGE